MDTPKVVAATFVLIPPPPTVSLSVTVEGSGFVTSVPGNLSCESGTCVENFEEGTKVTLSARSKADFMFAGWSSPCSGTESCEVMMTSTQKVMATFTPVLLPPVALNVSVEGEGRVTSDPIGIDCPGGRCAQEFENGLEVTLLPVPKTGHMFAGWSGACAGTEKCTVTLTSPMTVKAAFSLIPLPPVALAVTVEGEGRVTSDPAGVDCPSVTCTHDFENGKQVILLPEPQVGHMFDGWSGDCAGNENCIVTLGSPKTVKAVFTLIPLPPVALSVTVMGDGRVTSTPAGIDCPSVACAHNFDNGQMVILVASADTGQTFSRWTGACTGTGTSCQVEMTSPMAVTAEFVSGNPGLTDQEAKRFLEQATWGPTPSLMAHVKA
ncbi:MAG: InlB B-repeat-containing protein, partial [Nitrospirota bacterium]|nr:InlB B-repeat-containing protein [Nitrospirota bacterium]